MNCSQAETLFDAFLDGELSGALRLEFDAHRLRCTTCQKKIAMLEAFEQVVAAAPAPAALSSDFTDRVMARLAAGPPRARASHRRITLIGAAVLQAAAVVAFALLWPRGERPSAHGGSDALVADTSRLDEAMQDPTGRELTEYIHSALQRPVSAALRDRFGGLLRYAGDLALPDGILDGPVAGPLDGVLRSLLPAAASEPEGAAQAEDAPRRVPL